MCQSFLKLHERLVCTVLNSKYRILFIASYILAFSILATSNSQLYNQFHGITARTNFGIYLVSGLFAILVVFLLKSIFVKITSTPSLGAKVKFYDTFSCVTISHIPFAITTIISIVLLLSGKEGFSSGCNILSLCYFFSTIENKILISVFSMVNFFEVWRALIFAVCLKEIAGTKLTKGFLFFYIINFIFLLAGTLFSKSDVLTSTY